jgi:dTDP-4-amino-4,6-dideoxygalactose transaminase
MIPFVDLKTQYHSIKHEIDSVIRDVIENTSFIGGEQVKNFEKAFSEQLGVKNVISCANGTDSLYIILKMLGIKSGDEVITSAYSWISSSETISQAGAKPVFCDIDEDLYTLNADLIESLITENTKAIVAVHIHGQMCDMEKLQEISTKHNLFLIEDCAQAHLSEYKGQKAGTFGVAGSFSFYPGKNLGAYGDAGCMVTQNDNLARLFRMYANHGALVKHQHEMEGINSRMDGLQAAILGVKLKYLEKWTADRIDRANQYLIKLQGIPEVKLPVVRPDSLHSFHLFVVQAHQRNELMGFLKSHGIETAIHYPTALPNLEAYKYLNVSRDLFPVAHAQEQKLLSLPLFPELKDREIDFVCEIIKKFYS